MAHHDDIPPHHRQLFQAMDLTGDGTISSAFLIDMLDRNGLAMGDSRLNGFFAHLETLSAVAQDKLLSVREFHTAILTCSTLVSKAITGDLRVPDFQSLKNIIKNIYETVLPNESGDNADYIPQLAEVDPDQFAISITTVDGQHFSIGDHDKQFCIQSCSKPLSYILALKGYGPEYVHKYVGTEPSGHRFNHMALKSAPLPDDEGREIPHNPCINAGAIMSVSMVYPEMDDHNERLKKVIEYWKELSGGSDAPIGFDEETYKSESSTADRNWCLGFMMREKKSWPPCFSYDGTKSLKDTLELYFQICSILSTSKAMSIMAATLANGGLNPISGRRVCTPDDVRCALPLMLTCGMYDYSGQWAYEVGIPAKSGVGGCIYYVVPNVCGIAVWSPRLDDIGNSSRGVHVARELVKHIQIHSFEVFSGLAHKKMNPTSRRYADMQAEIGNFLNAASEGDSAALTSAVAAGTDLTCADYDYRTALHLAATEGHEETVRYLVTAANGRDDVINAKDRWGGTPLGDAEHNQFGECARILRDAGGQVGATNHYNQVVDEETEAVVSSEAPKILFAASYGDLHFLIREAARGESILVADYDRRTALHLAASNGHLEVTKYVVSAAKGDTSVLGAKDRFGNTPLDDAKRGGFDKCADVIAAAFN
jgi:glutaminase